MLNEGEPRQGAVGWWRRRGIQARSTIVATGIVAVASLVGAVLLLAALSLGLESSVRTATSLRAQDFAAQVASDDTDAAAAVIASQSDDGTLIQIIDASGRVTAASPALSGYPALVPPMIGVGAVTTQVVDGGMPDPGQYVIAATATQTTRGLVTVASAASLEERDHTVSVVRSALLLGIPLLLLAVAVTTWISVGRSLASVDHIRDEVEAIEADSLSLRVPVPPARDEVRRLAITMNEMLDRLESSMLEQRRFVADASHELKSPLAAMKTTLEVARRGPAGVDDVSADVLEAEIDRLSDLVGDLLLLARADEGVLGAGWDDVDLDDIVAAETGRLRATSRASLTVDVDAVRLQGDRPGLERTVRNLTVNASRFARSAIRITLARDTLESAVLVVEDDGPGIPVESRTVVFDRFVRLDPSRSRQSGGTGLGLAIVHDVVVAHSGTVAIDESPMGGARVTVRLPVAPSVEVDPA